MSYKAKFRSDRDIPLVTQEVIDKPMLTVENYSKWYSLYLIKTDGTVETLDGSDSRLEVLNLFLDSWRDHCITPEGFKKLADFLDAEYDNVTYESVCRRYESDYLELDGLTVD